MIRKSVRKIIQGFASKKQENKRKSQPPKVPAKRPVDYMEGPESFKQGIMEARQMRSASEANIEEQSLRIIILDERALLTKSLSEEALGKQPKGRVFDVAQKRYYLKRPLRLLQGLFFGGLAINLVGLGCLELLESYNRIGWFFGCVTMPSATSCIAILIGCNFASWVVAHALHLHLPTIRFSESKLSLVGAPWLSSFTLLFVAGQGALLTYELLFPSFPIHRVFPLLAATNIVTLCLNLRYLIRSGSVPIRPFISQIGRIISSSCLLVLLFSAYSLQLEELQEQYIGEGGRRFQIRKGLREFRQYFKQGKFLITEGQKINDFDE